MRRQTTPEEWATVIHHYQNGKSASEIAAMMDRTYGCITYILRRHGIRIRPGYQGRSNRRAVLPHAGQCVQSSSSTVAVPELYTHVVVVSASAPVS